MAIALRAGFTAEYQELFADIEKELSRLDCHLVWDILDMFRVVEPNVDRQTADKISAFGEQRLRWLRFTGLDLNDPREGRMMKHLRFLVSGGRWSEIEARLDDVGDQGNSPSPMLKRYERMLAIYQPLFQDKLRTTGIDAALHFDVTELQAIADASIHPSRRNA